MQLEKDYERRLVEYRTRLDALECEGDNEHWKNRVRAKYLMEKRFARNKDLNVAIDPSGFVYEGVTDNRVENATTTIYYKNEGYDEWGDYHNEAVKWDASEYSQQNPLLTDKDGKYQWFVPSGLWVPVAYYAPSGQRLQRPQKGLNIVQYADGTSKKIVVK